MSGVTSGASSPQSLVINEAVQALHDGRLVAFPTETVYGLAADAENETAVEKIYQVKKRPSDHPVIVHIGSIKYLKMWATDIPEYAFELAKQFWPGPLTLILKRSDLAKNYITGMQNSVAIRIPDNTVALSIINEFHKLGGNGIAAPSANLYGGVSPTTAQAVVEELGDNLNLKSDFIIDGGVCDIGLESTIISCLSSFPITLRPGKVMIDSTLKNESEEKKFETKVKHSGDKPKHYSPQAKVVLTGLPKKGDGFIALANIETPKGCIRLSSPSDSNEFAKSLYRSLKLGDKMKLQRIYIELPIGNGIEVAIRDRLLRAANE